MRFRPFVWVQCTKKEDALSSTLLKFVCVTSEIT